MSEVESKPLLRTAATTPSDPFIWLIFSLFGGLIYGYNVSIAPSLAYIADDLNLSTSQKEYASASATLSDACTMLLGGHLADHFGRKPIAMFACIMSILGAFGILTRHDSFTWFVFWRLCTGVGNALSILVIPMYISENLDMTRRGRCISYFQLGVLSGTVLPYGVMLLWENWLFCIVLGCIPSIVIITLFACGLFGESLPWISWKKKSTISNSSPLNSPTNSLKELFLGILLAYSNNSIDPTLFYGPEIIAQTLGTFSRHSSNVIGMLLCSISVLSVSFAAIFFSETFSRRSFYLLSHGIVVICFGICSLFFLTSPPETMALHPIRTYFVLFTMGIMVLFQTCGPGLLFVLIISELFQNGNIRAKYMSYCTFAMSGFSLCINGTMLSLFEWIGIGFTFGIYGLSYFISLYIFYKYLPETSNRKIMSNENI